MIIKKYLNKSEPEKSAKIFLNLEKIGFMQQLKGKKSTEIISIYVIAMGIIKCEKVIAGIFIFSSLFKIKMKVF